MVDIIYTEPICPKCKKETMKEWVHEYKCRNLECCLKIKKIFPPDPGAMKSYARIEKLEDQLKLKDNYLKDCERRQNIYKEQAEYNRK